LICPIPKPYHCAFCRKKFDWADYAKMLWRRYQREQHECVHKVAFPPTMTIHPQTYCECYCSKHVLSSNYDNIFCVLHNINFCHFKIILKVLKMAASCYAMLLHYLYILLLLCIDRVDVSAGSWTATEQYMQWLDVQSPCHVIIW